MPGKIFYRERHSSDDRSGGTASHGTGAPDYVLVAISGVDLKVYGQYLQMSELEQIAEAVNAELVHVSRGLKDHEDDEIEIHRMGGSGVKRR